MQTLCMTEAEAQVGAQPCKPPGKCIPWMRNVVEHVVSMVQKVHIAHLSKGEVAANLLLCRSSRSLEP